MKVDREELLTQLKCVVPGLAKKEIIEQSDCFIFDEGKVVTYNDEVACVTSVPLTDFSGAVPAFLLIQLLERMPDEEIDVAIEDGKFVVKGKGKRKASIRCSEEVLLPVENIEEAGKWKKTSENFSDAVRTVAFCAGHDMSMFFLTCIHFCPDKIEAGDNFRVCRYHLKTGLSESLLARSASVLKIFTDHEIIGVSVTESWIHFRSKGGTVFSCKKYEGKYPSVDALFDFEGDEMTFPKGLQSILDRCAVFTFDNLQGDEIEVRLKEGFARFCGQGMTGDYVEPKKIKYSGKPVKFMIGPKLLAEISGKSNKCVVGTGSLKTGTDDWEYVTCTMQDEDE